MVQANIALADDSVFSDSEAATGVACSDGDTVLSYGDEGSTSWLGSETGSGGELEGVDSLVG